MTMPGDFRLVRQKCMVVSSSSKNIVVRKRVETGDANADKHHRGDKTGGSASGVDSNNNSARWMKRLCTLSDIEPWMPCVGMALRFRRLQLGLSHNNLARMIGATPDYVRRIESGTTPMVHEMWQRIVHSTSTAEQRRV